MSKFGVATFGSLIIGEIGKSAGIIILLHSFFSNQQSLAKKHANGNDVIHVGHSSGAQTALRCAELYTVYEIMLVLATHSELGDAHEHASG